MSLSCHNLVLFKSPKDSSQVNHLAKQMFPGHVKYIQETFQDATKQPYGDLKLETPNDLRLRSNVLPGEMQCAYVKKSIKRSEPQRNELIEYGLVTEKEPRFSKAPG